MTSIFKAKYGNNEIRVENTWFNGDTLYINDKLQDKTAHFTAPARLTGHIVENGEKLFVKVNIYSTLFGLGIKCSIFVNDEEVKVYQIK